MITIVSDVFMPPTIKKLTGDTGFGYAPARPSVSSSRTVHARVSKFQIYRFLMGKYLTQFSCPSSLSFWSNAPLNKI